MEKRLDKLPVRKEKIQLGCSWRLSDMFDFKTGARNQKLLTNGRPRPRNVLDVGDPRKLDILSTASGKSKSIEGTPGWEMHSIDTFEIQVQNLWRQKCRTKDPAEKCPHSGMEQERSLVLTLLGQLQKSHKKAGKSSRRTPQKTMCHLEDEYLQSLQQSLSSAVISSDKQIIAEMLEEVRHQIYQENGGEDMQRNVCLSKQYEFDHVQMQIIPMRAKAIIDQIYMNRKYKKKNGAESESKQFIEAAEILKLNMDLFLKLMRDPYSPFVKNIKNLQFLPRDKERTKLFLEYNSLECQNDHQDPESSMRVLEKDTNNSSSKVKNGNRCSANARNASSLASSRIVILKPGSKVKQTAEDVSCHCSSLQSHQSFKNKRQIKRATFSSLKDIKRKFRQAVQEKKNKQNNRLLDRNLNVLVHDKHSLGDVNKGPNPASAGGTLPVSPNAKRREEKCKPADLTPRNETPVDSFAETVDKKINTSSVGYSKLQKFDIFLEAKRHLSERLKAVDLAESIPRKEAPRTLKMILSSHDLDLLESCSSNGHDNNVSAQRRDETVDSSMQNEKGKSVTLPRPPEQTEEASPCSDLITSDEQKQVFECRPDIPDNIDAATQELENIGSTEDDRKPCDCADSMEADDALQPDNSNILSMPYGPERFGNAINGQNNEAVDSCEDNGYMARAENSLLGPSLDSSSPLDICKLQIIENIEEKEEYRSPVSVLEPLSFEEEAVSPTSMMPEPAASQLQPRCLDFEDFSNVPSSKDYQIEASTCTDEEDSLSLYVRAIIQVSGLNFDKFSLEGTLCPDVLRSYIDDEVRPIACEVDCDIKLLLDCVHEAIVGVYQCHFGCSPWTSLLRPKIRPVPLKENFIDEVVKEVNFYLLPKTGQPTLDELTRKDIAKSCSWLDLRNDAEDILTQLAEDVLHDSIVDTILEVEI